MRGGEVAARCARYSPAAPRGRGFCSRKIEIVPGRVLVAPCGDPIYGCDCCQKMRRFFPVLAIVTAAAAMPATAQARSAEPKWPTISSETKGNVTDIQVMDSALAA